MQHSPKRHTNKGNQFLVLFIGAWFITIAIVINYLTWITLPEAHAPTVITWTMRAFTSMCAVAAVVFPITMFRDERN